MIEVINQKKREWLVEARINKGFKRKEVAEYLGISLQHYTDIENGKRNPSSELTLVLSRLLDFPIEKLLEDRTKFKRRTCSICNLKSNKLIIRENGDVYCKWCDEIMKRSESDG